MEELKTDEKLSSADYWDKVLKDIPLPRVNSPRSYHSRVTMEYIDECIRNGSYSTFFEVGCGTSGWLPYFAQKYGLKVSGIDYSEIGCKLAEENLRLLNISYGDIICRDIFEKDPTDGKKYDIVFSYGVIEHFDKPEEIIRVFSSFLNPGGIMITLVPNLNGAMGSLSRRFIADIYKMHKVITSEQLQHFHESNSLKILRNGYAGTFTVSVLPLIRSEHWLLRKDRPQGKLSQFLVKYFDKGLSKLFTWFRIDRPSEKFSPYIISIAEKNR